LGSVFAKRRNASSKPMSRLKGGSRFSTMTDQCLISEMAMGIGQKHVDAIALAA
jgi:hypothetical protein